MATISRSERVVFVLLQFKAASSVRVIQHAQIAQADTILILLLRSACFAALTSQVVFSAYRTALALNAKVAIIFLLAFATLVLQLTAKYAMLHLLPTVSLAIQDISFQGLSALLAAKDAWCATRQPASTVNRVITSHLAAVFYVLAP